MPENSKKANLRIDCLGQSMIEYILVFVAIVVVLIVALAPGGLFSNSVDQSLNEAIEGAKCMTSAICYDTDPTGNTCGSICP